MPEAAPLLELSAGGAELAIPLAPVGEVLEAPPLASVPLGPPSLAGVFVLRGELVPVLDLAARLGLPADASAKRVVTVRTEASGELVGLLVTSVATLMEGGRIRPRARPPEAASSIPRALVMGTVDPPARGRITVLHLERVLDLAPGGA